MHHKGLGRRVPEDFSHVERYRVQRQTVVSVERLCQLPYWHWTHDQGAEGACVGFGTSMAKAVIDLLQRKYNQPEPIKPYAVRFDSWWLWDRAKERDVWPDTNPGDNEGTSVRAAMDALRTLGHVRVKNTSNLREPNPVADPKWGIAANRWAVTVDEMRASIAAGVPVSIGVNWYSNFDYPVERTYNNYWIGDAPLGSLRGGHCVAVTGASDKRQAFRVKNSWGREYPMVWLPYTTMQRLLDEYGEATIITDK